MATLLLLLLFLLLKIVEYLNWPNISLPFSFFTYHWLLPGTNRWNGRGRGKDKCKGKGEGSSNGALFRKKFNGTILSSASISISTSKSESKSKRNRIDAIKNGNNVPCYWAKLLAHYLVIFRFQIAQKMNSVPPATSSCLSWVGVLSHSIHAPQLMYRLSISFLSVWKIKKL